VREEEEMPVAHSVEVLPRGRRSSDSGVVKPGGNLSNGRIANPHLGTHDVKKGKDVKVEKSTDSVGRLANPHLAGYFVGDAPASTPQKDRDDVLQLRRQGRVRRRRSSASQGGGDAYISRRHSMDYGHNEASLGRRNTESSRRHSLSCGKEYIRQPRYSERQQDSDHEDNGRPLVEVSPGCLVPLRGSAETKDAARSGNTKLAMCFVCSLNLVCISDAQMVMCPACRTVSPVEGGATNGGLGLGMREEEAASLSGSSNDSIETMTYQVDLHGFEKVAEQQNCRLIEKNVRIMSKLIQKIILDQDMSRNSSRDQTRVPLATAGIVQEVKEIIDFPGFKPKGSKNSSTNSLPLSVERELLQFVTEVAASYHDNPFHNFEHASHVCASADELLKRVNRSDNFVDSRSGEVDYEMELHYQTYGISSDPLTQLAIVFSALIHDAGHSGVPNSRLAEEEPDLAFEYGNQSIAEQRSVSISWQLFQSPLYSNLRSYMFENKQEQLRFRQLVINCVMATDIFDKELSAFRKARWEKGFSTHCRSWSANDRSLSNLKATSLIEYIIQASDVAHTMQDWGVYQQWNENLFREMYSAYLDRRAEKDPSIGWYGGELWFFDNHVIPLIEKLMECGAFGGSCEEFLNNALANRAEWERRGHNIVDNMLKNFCMDEVHGTFDR